MSVGVGDTVTSLITLALASGAPYIAISAILANIAAGIVISKLGFATVTGDELKHQLDVLGMQHQQYMQS